MNWLAIVLAALATLVVGALWYSPVLFGKLWLRYSGVAPEQGEAMKKKARRGYILGFIGQVIMVYVLALLWLQVGGSVYILGFWLWLGFMTPVMLGAVAWEGKPWNLYILNVAYQLVGILVAGYVLTLFG